MSRNELPASGEVFRYCRNCQFPLAYSSANFCPNCGQDTKDHPPSFWEFVHEFVGHYVAFEGRLVQTLGLLLFWPGELTRRYFAGLKVRYVLPLRLYISASLVFFIVVKLLGAGNLVKSPDEAAAEAAKPPLYQSQDGTVRVGERGAPAARITRLDEKQLEKPFVELLQCDPAPTQCNKLKQYLKEKYHDRPAAEVGRQVKDKVISLIPYALFLLMPVFALVTRLLYWRRKLVYGEHMVYALHVHAFSFVLLLAVSLASLGIAEWFWLAGLVYYWIAMQRVFGGRWWATGLRYLLIALGYPFLLSVTIFLTLVVAVFV